MERRSADARALKVNNIAAADDHPRLPLILYHDGGTHSGIHLVDLRDVKQLIKNLSQTKSDHAVEMSGFGRTTRAPRLWYNTRGSGP